ncbi:MAG TPA: RsmD family RNA methyltransferase [Opitutaceae bacterium]|nr:RsmD family RNA methyltransferase [Opitutaceae bacterium]
MRITGGRARGIPLLLPKGDRVRPAMDRMRQAVFSSLGAAVDGAVFVDLFAGSGSYGLEAVSRGAASGAFVEQDRKALACLNANLTAVCKSAGRDSAPFRLVGADAFIWRPAEGVQASLLFVDPPYRLIEANTERLFAAFDALLSSEPGARVVFEMPAELELQQSGWSIVKRLGGGGAGSAVACVYARTGG